jgi:hypothetical protein
MAKHSERSRQLAAWLKASQVERTQMRCPVCHRVIGVGYAALMAHFTSRACR